MKRITILILLIISLTIPAKAQEQLNKMQLADNLFNRDEYFKSLSIYLELASKSQPKLHAVERVAECYRLMNDYDKAEIWYEKAIADPEALMIDHYYYAEMLLRNKKFAQARDEYKLYFEYENPELLPFKLAVCDSAERWMKTPSTAYTIQNEQKFNSSYSDWGLNYLGDKDFIFTSDRKLSNKKQDIYNRNGDGYFKVYKTERDSVTALILKTKDNPIFTGSYHVGPMVLTSSGDTAYITVTTTVAKKKLAVDKTTIGTPQNLYTRRLQLVMATKINGQWANFKNFTYNKIKEYSIGHATLTKDGNVIYFTSDMPDGKGGTDIWYCVKKANGDWDKPINCGDMINTKDNESFPNLAGDDSSLYFSSNGLPGMGGLDIFKTTGKDTIWSKPINLKYPINSTSDDFYFLSRSNGLTGYFSSNREGGKGSDDIYSFGYKPPPVVAPPVIGTAPVNPTKPVISTPAVTTTAAIPSPQPSSALLNLKKGEGFILRNIYYDVNKSNIRPDAAEELDRLVEILKEHPTIRLEVSSHTDSRAPSTYNMALSRRRADSAVAYLVKNGIAPNRLVAVGYGDTQLLNKCAKGEYCTEEEHQINRRTEVHVLSE
jgi:outer membrane protein OmpA-like peptidoglycan-associated protein/outer membrane lipoprotein-sorting protein